MSASHRRSFRIENGRLISRHAPGLSHVAFSVNHPGCLPCRAARDEPCKESGRLNGYPARAAKLYRRTRLPRTDSCRQAPCQCSVPNGGLGPLFPETRSASLPELAGIRWATWRRLDPSSSPSASLAEAPVFSARTCWQFGPVAAAISHLSSGLTIGRAGSFFSERPISLRSSGLCGFGTVLEIRMF
jgi:hypothetical protein